MKDYKWKDLTGKVHIIPEGSCVICKHCTDIYLDPFRNNEIYLCMCELKEDTSCSTKCNDFLIDREVTI